MVEFDTFAFSLMLAIVITTLVVMLMWSMFKIYAFISETYGFLIMCYAVGITISIIILTNLIYDDMS